MKTFILIMSCRNTLHSGHLSAINGWESVISRQKADRLTDAIPQFKKQFLCKKFASLYAPDKIYIRCLNLSAQMGKPIR